MSIETASRQKYTHHANATVHSSEAAFTPASSPNFLPSPSPSLLHVPVPATSQRFHISFHLSVISTQVWCEFFRGIGGQTLKVYRVGLGVGDVAAQGVLKSTHILSLRTFCRRCLEAKRRAFRQRVDRCILVNVAILLTNRQ